MARYETAPYTTLEQDGRFELRAYGSYYTAAVRERDWANSEGFRQIFNYISGGNETGQKISMTTPVINELEPDRTTTEFVIPSEFSGKPLPRPMDPAIEIKANPERLTAVIRFSGTAHPPRVAQMEERLRQWIEGKGLRATGTPRLARYNPPFIPPFLRRNELLLDVRKD